MSTISKLLSFQFFFCVVIPFLCKSEIGNFDLHFFAMWEPLIPEKLSSLIPKMLKSSSSHFYKQCHHCRKWQDFWFKVFFQRNYHTAIIKT